MASRSRLVILIPARSGSQRIPGKNTRPLGGHPLIAYTISAALESNIAYSVVVSTDSDEIALIGQRYGAEVPFLEPSNLATPISPDIEWVSFALDRLRREGRDYDCFSILRPTSPFRQTATIHRAWKKFLAEPGADSLRAVERCKQHPGKMWVVKGNRMTPLLPLGPPERPWHSSPYQLLPDVYVQNASLEIAWTRVVFEEHTIAGSVVVPFVTSNFEGFDLNDENDWLFAEYLIGVGAATLPTVSWPMASA